MALVREDPPRRDTDEGLAFRRCRNLRRHRSAIPCTCSLTYPRRWRERCGRNPLPSVRRTISIDSSFGQDVALHLLSEAHAHAQAGKRSAEWDQSWAKLSGGKVLTAAIRRYMAGGTFEWRRAGCRFGVGFAQAGNTKPELAENVLLRHMRSHFAQSHGLTRVCGNLARSALSCQCDRA